MHQCKVDQMFNTGAEEKEFDASTIFKLDEEPHFSLSCMETRSRSASLDNHSIRQHSTSIIGGGSRTSFMRSTSQERIAFSDLAILMSQQQMTLDKILKMDQDGKYHKLMLNNSSFNLGKTPNGSDFQKTVSKLGWLTSKALKKVQE